MGDRERRESIPHVSALDGARGAAVAGVVLFHANHLKGGYLGVDFFFTLSGFLITSLLLAEASSTGGVSLGSFWARRARRLLPALAVLLTGVALYSATLAKPSELAQIRGDAFATLAYVANWHEIFSNQSYFGLFNTPSLLNHTWSLAIEEQFYLIWPLLFVALLVRFKGSTPRAVLATSLSLAAVSGVLMILLYNPLDSDRVYFGTDTRAAAILLGAALAAWLAIYGPTRSRARRVTLEVVALLGAVVLAVAWARLDGQSNTLYRGGFLVCGLAATMIIAAAVHPDRGPISRVLSFRPLCALGLISYGVYLYHWPFDVILNSARVRVTGWPLFAVQTLATLALAIGSYKFIEQPVRRGVLSHARWRRLAPVVALVLVVVLFAATSGAKSAETPTLAAEVQSASDTRLAKAGATIARRAAPAGAERILIVGNSVGSFLGPEFKMIRANPPLAVLDDAIPACFFPQQLDAPAISIAGHSMHLACHPSWEADAVNIFRPDVAFWIVSDITYRGVQSQGNSVRPCTQAFDTAYERGLRTEVARLGATGAKVVITTEAYNRSIILSYPDRYIDCDNQLRRAVAAETGAHLVDLFSYICPHGQCRQKQDGLTLRPDGLHYQGPGGELVAKWLLGQVH